jgi:hypothetical protein
MPTIPLDMAYTNPPSISMNSFTDILCVIFDASLEVGENGCGEYSLFCLTDMFDSYLRMVGLPKFINPLSRMLSRVSWLARKLVFD